MSNNYTSSIQGLSGYLGVSPGTIQRWERLPGYPAKEAEGYNIDAISTWAINNPSLKKAIRLKIQATTGLVADTTLDDLEQDTNDSPALERFRAARAEQEELKLAIQKKELVKLDEYIQAEANRYSIFKRSLEQLTMALPPRLMNLTQEEMRKELQSGFDELLRQLQREIK